MSLYVADYVYELMLYFLQGTIMGIGVTLVPVGIALVLVMVNRIFKE